MGLLLLLLLLLVHIYVLLADLDILINESTIENVEGKSLNAGLMWLMLVPMPPIWHMLVTMPPMWHMLVTMPPGRETDERRSAFAI